MSSGLFFLDVSSIAAHSDTQRILSCRSDHEGRHFFSQINYKNKTEADILLPQRGHGVSTTRDGRLAAVFARRPGDFVWIIDLETQQVMHKIHAPNERHYYGHGVFTGDGAALLCSENAYEEGKGVIGVYDVHDNYKRVAEFESYGVGPHEIKLLPDSKTLVVANGGIDTHPDSPRVKLNLDSMRPNLAYIDIASGRLLHKHELEPELHQLSIRHIDISSSNTVAIAMQFQGAANIHPPLIAIQRDDEPIKLLTAPDDVQTRLRNYCGSVVLSDDDSTFLVSSPRAGLTTLWSDDGVYLGAHGQADACGVACLVDGRARFLISDGTGAVTELSHDLTSTVYYASQKWHWDNHLYISHS